MKIAIIGHSGSGKSTLAQKLSEKYQLPVLHFDAVQFRPGWEIRPQASKEIMTKVFLDLHTSWVIDGNYSKLYYPRRMEEADVIVVMPPRRTYRKGILQPCGICTYRRLLACQRFVHPYRKVQFGDSCPFYQSFARPFCRRNNTDGQGRRA